jgi:uridine kinase
MSSVVSPLAAQLRAAPAKAGPTRVLAIDGRSGAGKSTLALKLQRELDAELITLDYLYGGWDGLSRGVALLVKQVLEPLSHGDSTQVPHYDWDQGQWQEPRELIPPAFLVVEGVGAGSRQVAKYTSVLVWLSATSPTRKRRGMDRDPTYETHWDAWTEQEDLLFAQECPWERADVVLSTESDSLR